MNIVGNKYGKWTVVEQCSERKNGAIQIVVECECGSKKTCSKAIFTHGTSSDKCKKCHLRLQRSLKMSIYKKK